MPRDDGRFDGLRPPLTSRSCELQVPDPRNTSFAQLTSRSRPTE